MTLSHSEQSELFDIAGAICEGMAVDEQLSRLASILSSSADARLSYARYLDLHVQIGRRMRGGDHAVELGLRSAPPSSGHSVRRVPPNARRYAIAAAMLIAGVAAAVHLALTGRPTPPEDQTAPAAPVASLIDATSELLVNGELALAGEAYRPGTYSIEHGEAELLLTSLVSVTLSGQTSLTMHTDRSVTLARGSASFDCPHTARGFTVHLPGGAKVIDLGTAFVVEVAESGDASVRVTEGRVRIIESDAGDVPGRSVELAVDQIISLGDRGRTLGPIVTVIRPVGYSYVGARRPGDRPGQLDTNRLDESLVKLTDGDIGEHDFRDERWVGVFNPDRNVEVASPAVLFDLGEPRMLDLITITYLVDHEAGIHAPVRAVIRIGDSPEALGEPVELEGFDDASDPSAIRVGDVRTHTLRFAPMTGRYLRLDLYTDAEWTFLCEFEFSSEAPGASEEIDSPSPASGAGLKIGENRIPRTTGEAP